MYENNMWWYIIHGADGTKVGASAERGTWSARAGGVETGFTVRWRFTNTRRLAGAWISGLAEISSDSFAAPADDCGWGDSKLAAVAAAHEINVLKCSKFKQYYFQMKIRILTNFQK